jgi:hypothetical protein
MLSQTVRPASVGTQQASSAAYQTIIIQTCNSTTAGAGSTVANTFRRGKWYDILVGTNGSPADNFMEFEVARVTTGSTATNLAANPLDSADQAHITSVCVNSSSFGTDQAASLPPRCTNADERTAEPSLALAGETVFDIVGPP